MSDIVVSFGNRDENEELQDKKVEKIRKQVGGKDNLSELKAQSKDTQKDKILEVVDQIQSGIGIEIDENDTDLLEKILGAYVSEESCYVVDDAIITCDHMSDKEADIEYQEEIIKYSVGKECIEIENTSGYTDIGVHFYKSHVGEEGIGRLHAVHATEQTDNGKMFATVIDRNCQREIDEGKVKGKASILSFGNCGILKESDVEEIESRREKARKFGTCYSLIKLVSEWTNPICVENLINECQGIELPVLTGPRSINRNLCLTPSHNKVMKWDTANGQKEGLTILSTLLCKRGGIISIAYHGQSISIESFFEVLIYQKINEIHGNDIDTIKAMQELPTIEALARMIYQESHTFMNGEQNAILFSLLNRCFKGNYTYGKEVTIHNILFANNAYTSLNSFGNAYTPPKDEDSMDYLGWENAKRLAAIMIIAFEICNSNSEVDYDDTDVGLITIERNEENKERILQIIENQVDSVGNIVSNPIGDRPSFHRVSSSYVPKEGEKCIYTDGKKERGGHVFYYNKE